MADRTVWADRVRLTRSRVALVAGLAMVAGAGCDRYRGDTEEAANIEVDAETADAQERVAEDETQPLPNLLGMQFKRLTTLATETGDAPLVVVVPDQSVVPAQVILPDSRPGDTSAANTQYIVRINDDELKAQVLNRFRADNEGARAAFRQWATANDFDGLELVKVNYSGEIILRLADDAPATIRETFRSTSARAMAEKLTEKVGVVYADPDYTARIEDDAR